MSIFNFGKRQRMHTQMLGHTTGKEMFQVDEYNTQNKMLGAAIILDAIIFTLLYFGWSEIPTKITVFMLIAAAGFGFMGYSALKTKKRLRQRLY